MIYFKFEDCNEQKPEKDSFAESFVVKILSKLLPKANPDFEQKFPSVKYWLIEFDEENSLTNREIGLDQNSQPLTKAPFKNNLGIWCDSDLKLPDYENSKSRQSLPTSLKSVGTNCNQYSVVISAPRQTSRTRG